MALLQRTFEETDGYDEIVVLKDIRFESHCEHHIAPIIGKAHIAYLPNNRVVGISKLARLVEVYAKRLQIQEKMTAQIANTLDEVLQPKGVAVVIEAAHQCMTTRGVHKPGVSMVTSRMLGVFRTDPTDPARGAGDDRHPAAATSSPTSDMARPAPAKVPCPLAQRLGRRAKPASSQTFSERLRASRRGGRPWAQCKLARDDARSIIAIEWRNPAPGQNPVAVAAAEQQRRVRGGLEFGVASVFVEHQMRRPQDVEFGDHLINEHDVAELT